MTIELPIARPPEAEPFRIGSSVGQYQLLEVLGEGAMGTVYLAEHQVIRRKVALKMLRRAHANDATAVQRFFEEARAVNRISHPNIVEITDFIENSGGANAFVMELLRGESLKAVLQREHPLALERGLALAAQVARALEAVHVAGIIHRDLKPDNVFLTERGGVRDFVKLLDFGVAKSLVAGDAALHETNAGAILGTPEYMSPEQVAAKTVDQRSDIYSFGVLAYELFTGKKPFEAQNFGEIVIKHLTQPPVAPSKLRRLPKALDTLIQRCLAKHPSNRPQQMGEVARTLETLQATLKHGERLAAAKVSPSRTTSVLAAATVLGLAAGVVILVGSSRSLPAAVAIPAAAPPSPTTTGPSAHTASPPVEATIGAPRLPGPRAKSARAKTKSKRDAGRATKPDADSVIDPFAE